MRERVLAARRALDHQQRARDADALARHLRGTARPGTTVCAYVPVGSEPGSAAMLDVLVAVGARVLLPVARESDGVPRPLDWGEYRPGELVAAPFGLREPPPPWLAPDAVGDAALVLVPALAVDRRGTRLGRGAGYYDRSLTLTDRAAWLVAIVRDDELLDEVPGEPHDVAMTHALTPARGLAALS